jgi:hypothetical protein
MENPIAHIALAEGLPGIRGPMVFSLETTNLLCELVQVLLTEPHSLTLAEPEMIATFVSSENGLATRQPHDPDVYLEIGQHTARLGYVGRDYKKALEAIAAKQGCSIKKVAGS